MSKIYFKDGELSKLTHLLQTDTDTCNIELIKKYHKYKKILIEYIIPVLTDLIIEYINESILIELRYFKNNKVRMLTVTLQNNFMVLIQCWNNNTHNIIVYKKSSPILLHNIINRNTYRPPILANSVYFYADVFFNYYMEHYYGYKLYISLSRDIIQKKNMNIYKNIYRTKSYKKDYYNHTSIKLLDHKKIKQMIIITKLLLNILLKSRNPT